MLIQFYKRSNGRQPVVEFLDSLSGKQAKKVTWTLQLIEEMDRPPKQYFKKLVGTNQLWEKDAIRLLGFIDKGKFVVLTNGFMKKSQKTPKIEIELAEKRRKDYLGRKKK